TKAQITPRPPKISKEWRQPTRRITSAPGGGVNAPDQRALSHMMPCARTRSFSGSQVVKALVTLGKQPASPAPKRKRVTVSERKFQAHPVAAVKKLHHSTIRVSTLRGPRRSPRYPPGISNRAYAQPKAAKTAPIWRGSRPRSLEMNGAAKEMETRSM